MGLNLVNTKNQSVSCKDCQNSSPCLSCLALYERGMDFSCPIYIKLISLDIDLIYNFFKIIYYHPIKYIISLPLNTLKCSYLLSISYLLY